MLEPVVIVPVSAVRRGKIYRRLWWGGWALAIFGGSFGLGQAVAYGRAMEKVAEARQEIEQVRKDQVMTTAAFVKAWEDQRRGIDLVTTWAQYIKDRDDLIRQNRDNPPIPIVLRR